VMLAQVDIQPWSTKRMCVTDAHDLSAGSMR